MRCNADSCLSRCNVRRHGKRHSKRHACPNELIMGTGGERDLFPFFPWMKFHCTRSEEHHEVRHRSAIPPELRERVRRWHQRMVDPETGTCMHMRHILLDPGDFRFLSRQQNGRSYPSYACIGRMCLFLFDVFGSACVTPETCVTFV